LGIHKYLDLLKLEKVENEKNPLDESLDLTERMKRERNEDVEKEELKDDKLSEPESPLSLSLHFFIHHYRYVHYLLSALLIGLSLDRFNDFSSEILLSPVKEASAMAVSTLMKMIVTEEIGRESQKEHDDSQIVLNEEITSNTLLDFIKIIVQLMIDIKHVDKVKDINKTAESASNFSSQSKNKNKNVSSNSALSNYWDVNYGMLLVMKHVFAKKDLMRLIVLKEEVEERKLERGKKGTMIKENLLNVSGSSLLLVIDAIIDILKGKDNKYRSLRIDEEEEDEDDDVRAVACDALIYIIERFLKFYLLFIFIFKLFTSIVGKSSNSRVVFLVVRSSQGH
jgi:hypothetical protein